MKAKLLNFYFFIAFLFTAQPCDIFNVTDVGHPTSIIVMGLFSVFMCLKFKVKLVTKKLCAILLLMVLWGYLQKTLLNRNPSPLIYFEIFIAYAVFSLYKDDLFERFEKISVKLSTLAICLWMVCLVAYRPMFELAELIGDRGSAISQSLYIFSIPRNVNNVGFLLRNCGYSWEPGRFACMLIVALWFNILRTNLDLKDKNFRILTLALVTSQSTTGYVIFVLMIATYYLVYKKWNPAMVILGGMLVIASLSLPFMQKKIVGLYQGSQDMTESIQSMEYVSKNKKDAQLYIPQRFDGFMFQLMNFENANKLIGDGRNYQNYYLNKKLGYPIVASEGILTVFIRYGWIIAMLMYYALFSSSACFCRKYNNKGKLLFPILFIGLNFSYYLWAAPIFMALWLWSYWNGNLVGFKRLN